jgi:hypothetical protein
MDLFVQMMSMPLTCSVSSQGMVVHQMYATKHPAVEQVAGELLEIE